MNINSVKNQYLKNNTNTNINKFNNTKAPLENAALNYKTDTSEIKSIKDKNLYNQHIVEGKINFAKSVSSTKINELKEMYKADNCPVSSMKIAGTILNNIIGITTETF